MTEWTSDELNRMGDAEEIRIAGLKADGSLRKPVIIWIVRVGDDLFVRSANGRSSAWFRGVQVRYEGRIWASGAEVDVAFVEQSEPEINDKIDEAYLAKYARYPQWVAPMVTAGVRAATLKLEPRN